jgi:hypothetical protein
MQRADEEARFLRDHGLRGQVTAGTAGTRVDASCPGTGGTEPPRERWRKGYSDFRDLKPFLLRLYR